MNHKNGCRGEAMFKLVTAMFSTIYAFATKTNHELMKSGALMRENVRQAAILTLV